MEFTFVRGIALFIALIGFGATTTSHSPKGMDDSIIGGGAPPTCLPNTGNFCGMQ
jgi:hypothetical protein